MIKQKYLYKDYNFFFYHINMYKSDWNEVTSQLLSPFRFQCFLTLFVSADGTKLANGLIFGFKAKIFLSQGENALILNFITQILFECYSKLPISIVGKGGRNRS